MEKEQRNRLQKATQDARKLLEEEFSSQLLQTYDIDVERVRWAEEPGAHLQAEQQLIREKLVAWIEHKEAQINDRKEALLLALREMAFTALNRFVALKLMEARELVRPCVSGGLESAGFLEFTAMAQGLLADQESSYRLYLETIFEDVSRELRALFDPRDPASLLWPKRAALLELLDILNRPELAELWSEDETLGWVYQYFNGDAERKKMREESSAPRNSRELAVRNQFFTPRYVVEFLTDNTLGRIWYEMCQGNTGLKDQCRYLVRRPNEVWLQPGEEGPEQADADEALSQEELLRQPVYIPHRSLKDPREIRMLDPACGSMHFGLYAFDLYLEIYKEAWEIAQGSDEQSKQEEAFSPFVAYAAGFVDKSAFLREVPRLILQHNIHGVDIDPRATQIAKLTLWLRAQRAWQEQGLEVVARPAVTRSNVVCAEPMPGERELLADFVDQQFPEAERGLVQQLLEVIFDKMQLAGEAGSLLKIEEEIRNSINQSRRDWQKLAVQQQNLFSTDELAALGRLGSSLNSDLESLTSDFWIDIEDRIYVALRDFAAKADRGREFQRQLFVDDAARGFAFIDTCRRRYDLALMNPPFGDGAKESRVYMQQAYPSTKNDIYASFIQRFTEVIGERGLLGAITSRTGLFLSSFQKWREEILLDQAPPVVVADLGYGVLDSAMVETAAYCLERAALMEASFIRLVDVEVVDKAQALLDAVIGLFRGHQDKSRAFLIATSKFSEIPLSPFSYWASSNLRSLYKRHPRLSSDKRIVTVGASTKDNNRFARAWWEVPSSEIAISREATTNGGRWVPFAKGGGYAPFYQDVNLVLDWANDGHGLKTLVSEWRGQRGWGYHWTAELSGHSYYFQHGLTYGARVRKFSPQAFGGGIFSGSSYAIITGDPLLYLALLNASLFRFFLSLQTPPRKVEVGHVQNFPMPSGIEGDPLAHELRSLALNSYSVIRGLDTGRETGHAFCLPPLLQAKGRSIKERACFWQNHKEEAIKNLAAFQDEIDRIAFRLYDIGADDQDSIGQLCASEAGKPGAVSDVAEDEEKADSQGAESDSLETSFAVSMASFAVGACLGRWDIRCATKEHQLKEQHDPFAPLPICPPGQLQNAQGFPAGPDDVPANYPVRIPWDGIIVDDPNHPLDLEFRIREVIEIIWSGQAGGTTAEAIEHEACDILDVKVLRHYFRKPAGFFANHLSSYSKSRRQAPIYWQLTAGSGSYSAWLYYHRFTQDTLYRVLRDFVEPRIQQAEREQFELESQGSLSGEAANRLQETQTLLQDLRILKSELDLVAPLWNPNLNDGVIVNHAILWRITPYTPWQKKCKECWDKLVKGDYDWAHLAFHLWPERVIPKCTTDRSLAIAHGLEERLWQETNNGNWLPRQLSEADLQALISEHSNPAVKSALERFLAAPPPVAPTRTRASRSTRGSGSSTPRRARGSAVVVDAEATRQVLLALTAAPSDGLAKTQIADLIGVEANALTAVIKQLKEGGQIDQLGERRGARYVLSEQGRAAVASQAGEGD
jgi:hypothetical protein